MCALSSHPPSDRVNSVTPDVANDGVAQDFHFHGFHAPPPRQTTRRRTSLRVWLRLEYGLHEAREQAAPKPIPEPPQAAATLGALACRFNPGDRVSLAEAAELAGISTAAVSRVRRWARSVNRWPYKDSLGFGSQSKLVRRRQGGG